eukprot:gnl/TRDRNA2_/TRDRNA2_206987_c0_seq1.p1 gnl/TRDRNA2_/TRDRNA2_206987_c0~~gnl/TRDRNA2_/TRDRNA2_206987_c0_seq1.p1  ORF type:complete len:331 (-),score=12.82 gnl/TRDRNA2_/TRDRNA2_206987_c0_seq1:7-954(-)
MFPVPGAQESAYLEANPGNLLCVHPDFCRIATPQIPGIPPNSLEELYLYTLMHSLTGSLLATKGTHPLDVFQNYTTWNATKRYLGLDMPEYGMTMTGVARMQALHMALHIAYNNRSLSGDFLEAGVWRGGSSIYAKGFLTAYKVRRRVWVVDSFQGLPGKEHVADKPHWEGRMAVSYSHVKDNFMRHQLLDTSVVIVKGFFNVTLPRIYPRLRRLAVLRLDADMYKSTLEIMCNLYGLLEVGGLWMVDDFDLVWETRRAVMAFVAAHAIEDDLAFDYGGASTFVKKSNVSIKHDWCRHELRKGSSVPSREASLPQ